MRVELCPVHQLLLFFVLMQVGIWTCTYSSVLVDLSKNVVGVCRGVCEVGNRTSFGKRRCQTPIRQPLPASMRVRCVQCAESISCDPSGGAYECA